MTAVLKVLRRLQVFAEEYVPGVLLAVMTALVAFGVGSRYGFGNPVAVMNEATVLMAIWTVFLASSAAVAKRTHIGLEYVLQRLQGRRQAAVDLVISGVGLVVLGVMAVLGWQFAMETGLRLQVLGISKTAMWMALPAGSALMSLRFLERMVLAVRGLRTGEFEIPRTAFEALMQMPEEIASTGESQGGGSRDAR